MTASLVVAIIAIIAGFITGSRELLLVGVAAFATFAATAMVADMWFLDE